MNFDLKNVVILTITITVCLTVFILSLTYGMYHASRSIIDVNSKTVLQSLEEEYKRCIENNVTWQCESAKNQLNEERRRVENEKE